MRISLLRFLKTFHKYLPYLNFALFISLVQFFWAKYLESAIFWLFISILRFALCKFWAIYFISAIFWLFFAQKIALMK